MIEVNQNSIQNVGTPSLIKKVRNCKVNIDKEKLTYINNSLNKKREKIKSRILKDKIDNKIKFLNTLDTKSDTEFSIYTSFTNGKIVSYPLEIAGITEFNEDIFEVFTSKIEDRERFKLVRIKYENITNIIAFELMFKDLGETDESVEELLENFGIVSVYESNEFVQAIGDGYYSLSKECLIECTPYFNKDNMEIRLYCNNKSIPYTKGMTYESAVYESCRLIMQTVLTDIIQKVTSRKLNMQIVGIDENEICVLLPIEIYKKCNIYDIYQDIVIKSFGRKIKVEVSVEEESRNNEQ